MPSLLLLLFAAQPLPDAQSRAEQVLQRQTVTPQPARALRKAFYQGIKLTARALFARRDVTRKHAGSQCDGCSPTPTPNDSDNTTNGFIQFIF